MARFHVFLKAPTSAEFAREDDEHTRQWHTFSTASPLGSADITADSAGAVGLPSATLEAASRRISMHYENVIFKDVTSEDEDEEARDVPGNTQDATTFITWPPTSVGDRTRASESAFLGGREITFLTTGSFVRSRIQPETQETQETNSYSYSGMNTDASDTSIARFPEFHFSLHTLSSLTALDRWPGDGNPDAYPFHTNKHKVNLLVAIFEVEGPDTIHIKRGPEAGREVSILKVIVGDEDGGVCRLTAWREVAERWGGTYSDSTEPSIKRGDIVHLQNVLVSKDSTPPAAAAAPTATTSSVLLTASPALGSSLSICYRTMPWKDDPTDVKLRPDLRLGHSDATVRKVSAVVRWFQGMAGLPVM